MSTVAKLVRRTTRKHLKELQHNWPLPMTYMGIELEVEMRDSQLPPEIPTGWEHKEDGSLTNGVEYVLARPMRGDELRGAINSVFNGARFSRSVTGSTHIHIDMLDEDSTTHVLQVLVLLVYCFEDVLFAVGDPDREWCGFANKMQSGPDTIISVVLSNEMHQGSADAIARFSQTYGRHSSAFGRYYALNMASLLDYGSLEFRYFPTATSEEELITWVELVQQFKKAAIALGSLSELSNVFNTEQTYREFIHTHFSKFADLFLSVSDYRRVRSNFRKAQLTAMLTSNEGPVIVPSFPAHEVFANGRFSRLVTNVPDAAAVANVIRVPGDYEQVPQANAVENNTVLLYNRAVYTNAPYGMQLYDTGEGRNNRWRMITDFTIEQIRANEELVEALRTLINSGDVEAESWMIGYIIDAIEGTGTSVFPDIAPDYDDEDYEEEE